jgi:hypothetical protein
MFLNFPCLGYDIVGRGRIPGVVFHGGSVQLVYPKENTAETNAKGEQRRT